MMWNVFDSMECVAAGVCVVVQVCVCCGSVFCGLQCMLGGSMRCSGSVCWVSVCFLAELGFLAGVCFVIWSMFVCVCVCFGVIV